MKQFDWCNILRVNACARVRACVCLVSASCWSVFAQCPQLVRAIVCTRPSALPVFLFNLLFLFIQLLLFVLISLFFLIIVLIIFNVESYFVDLLFLSGENAPDLAQSTFCTAYECTHCNIVHSGIIMSLNHEYAKKKEKVQRMEHGVKPLHGAPQCAWLIPSCISDGDFPLPLAEGKVAHSASHLWLFFNWGWQSGSEFWWIFEHEGVDWGRYILKCLTKSWIGIHFINCREGVAGPWSSAQLCL